MLDRLIAWTLLTALSVVTSVMLGQAVAPPMKAGLTKLAQATSLVP
jgi:hypothetical protein